MASNDDWRELSVSEFAEVIGGTTPSTSISSHFGGDVPWITPKDLSNFQGRYISRGERNITREGVEAAGLQILPKGTVLLSTRAPIGYVAIAANALTTNQGFRNLVVKSGFEPEYVFYLLKQNTDRLKSFASGTTFGELSGSTLKRLRFSIPPLSEQRAIAQVLGSLDDKIDLNRRMNQTLEEICRTLFKFWFVDFGPVRAKAEGRWKNGKSLPGMPADMWDLWPSEFEESEIGEIPKGWQVKTVGEVAEFLYGVPLKEQDRNGGEVPVFGSNGIIGWHDKRLVDGPGIVVGRKGSPGTVTWASGDFWPIDTTFYVVRSKESPPMDYLFYALAQLDLPSLEADSAVPGLNRRAAIGSRIVVPQPEITSRFEMTVTPLRSRVAKCLAESGTLSSYRDALLPKLLSGEVRVKVDS